MALSPKSSSLELSISLPSFSQLSSHPSSGEHMVRDLDINQTPKTEDREWMMIAAEPYANEEDSNSCGRRRKKLRLTKEQSHLLEDSFIQKHTLTSKQKLELATFLKLSQRQVEVWFQNRRARSKLKHTEMECKYLKRCFGSLKEQNRLLQKEVEELRALNAMPASILTMCPRCERATDATDNAVKEGTATRSQSRRTISSSSSLC
ncbi:PREDICTED: homeobox-leucine zipper protein ATHB-X-like [Brassica oleracea var. oleracea]|uniref:homeobox-leucine zipper protein ATHB-X-like n=1 Tax=Brassica oleracea var. oleracea TaxID=109376 RepID=UPI0006A75554|nr:PREDICTED: homeobox-leucine zipper protein ATHB-X-like [Brassica oleracea var. oleracea]